VTVTGVVIAEAGRLGTPPLLAIADATAGIAVHLPDDTAAPQRGTRVQVTGKLADPYGQLEIRPSSSGFRVVGSGPLPAPRDIDASTLGESTRQPRPSRRDRERQADKASSGDITFFDCRRSIRIVADASSGLRRPRSSSAQRTT
jgi:hypothetical protein